MSNCFFYAKSRVTNCRVKFSLDDTPLARFIGMRGHHPCSFMLHVSSPLPQKCSNFHFQTRNNTVRKSVVVGRRISEKTRPLFCTCSFDTLLFVSSDATRVHQLSYPGIDDNTVDSQLSSSLFQRRNKP